MISSGAGSGAPRARVPALALALSLLAVPFAETTLKGRATAETTLKGRATGDPEVRALWVLRGSLTSPRTIAAMVAAARDHGFNTIFVQVRGRGDAYYAGGVEPRAADLAGEPASFDPLQETIAAARAAGLRVHAWFNVNLVASATELPADRNHIVYRHPAWLMVPRELATQIRAFEPDNPAYAGAISRWTRSQPGLVEGLYTSPIVPAAADHTLAVVTDLVTRYDLDGLHLDYVRYPNDAFDHSRFAIDEFRNDVAPTLPERERRTLDERAEVDPFAWPDAYQDRWRQFRRARLSALVMRLRTALKTHRPRAMLTAAVAPDIAEAYDRRLQDWQTWIESGLLDVVCPMAYTPELATFEAQILAARGVAGPRGLWAGIGAYRLTPAETLEHIHAARRAGAAGVALFSYDSLVAPSVPADYLAAVGRAAFGATGAAAPGSR
jgi:uncharacterized lipoprotein YddW (UPF0748 family)